MLETSSALKAENMLPGALRALRAPGALCDSRARLGAPRAPGAQTPLQIPYKKKQGL